MSISGINGTIDLATPYDDTRQPFRNRTILGGLNEMAGAAPIFL